jgi:hypothetical protein
MRQLAKVESRPKHFLADVLARVAELLPWNWQPLEAIRGAA